jgi:hypothetical protein
VIGCNWSEGQRFSNISTLSVVDLRMRPPIISEVITKELALEISSFGGRLRDLSINGFILRDGACWLPARHLMSCSALWSPAFFTVWHEASLSQEIGADSLHWRLWRFLVVIDDGFESPFFCVVRGICESCFCWLRGVGTRDCGYVICHSA